MSTSAAENSKYTFSSPRTQSFPFPSDVISSILRNPSSYKGLSKLYQTCKYFYSKRPLLIISGAKFYKAPLYGIGVGDFEIRCGERRDKNVLSLNNLLWFTWGITFEYYYESSRLPKFFRCSLKKIVLDRSHLYFDDFVILTSEKDVTIFQLDSSSSIIYSDGSYVSIVEMLKLLPNVTKFICNNTCEDYSNDIFQKLSLIQLESKLSYLNIKIDSVSENINSDYILKFIVNNEETDGGCCIQLWSQNDELRPVLKEIVQKWEDQKPKKIE